MLFICVLTYRRDPIHYTTSKVEMEYIYFVDIQDYLPLKCFPTFLSASFSQRF